MPQTEMKFDTCSFALVPSHNLLYEYDILDLGTCANVVKTRLEAEKVCDVLSMWKVE